VCVASDRRSLFPSPPLFDPIHATQLAASPSGGWSGAEQVGAPILRLSVQTAINECAETAPQMHVVFQRAMSLRVAERAQGAGEGMSRCRSVWRGAEIKRKEGGVINLSSGSVVEC